ncbi:uncharacterized protein LOC100907506 [Galendromus occidentalis]|uniref:Uncharacterized protein LOC100907506 n=1 Tax=Galendromus occidentalis TaxID=34638 RepID=A0AAJ6QPK9_9ACAR|nr:uncharacterized protein LOC100907506 [Galendromus occidentalis]
MDKEKASESSADEPNFLVARFRQWYQNLPPYTTVSLTRFYIPLAGAVGYCALSVNVFVPQLLQRVIPLGSYGAGSLLLLSSHLGVGFYMFYRRHMSVLMPYQRTMYSMYSSVLFNLGSFLLWAFARNVVPRNGVIRSCFAVSGSVTMLNLGMEYLDHVDSEFRL